MLTTTPLRSPFDGWRADADDVDAVVGELTDDGADLRRADVQADDDLPGLLLRHDALPAPHSRERSAFPTARGPAPLGRAGSKACTAHPAGPDPVVEVDDLRGERPRRCSSSRTRASRCELGRPSSPSPEPHLLRRPAATSAKPASPSRTSDSRARLPDGALRRRRATSSASRRRSRGARRVLPRSRSRSSPVTSGRSSASPRLHPLERLALRVHQVEVAERPPAPPGTCSSTSHWRRVGEAPRRPPRVRTHGWARHGLLAARRTSSDQRFCPAAEPGQLEQLRSVARCEPGEGERPRARRWASASAQAPQLDAAPQPGRASAREQQRPGRAGPCGAPAPRQLLRRRAAPVPGGDGSWTSECHRDRGACWSPDRPPRQFLATARRCSRPAGESTLRAFRP